MLSFPIVTWMVVVCRLGRLGAAIAKRDNGRKRRPGGSYNEQKGHSLHFDSFRRIAGGYTSACIGLT
jgi:hypothetical protein